MQPENDRLSEAVQLLRDATPAERLSGEARERILASAQRRYLHADEPIEALSSLFAPGRWLAAAGVLPVLLAGLFVLGLERPAPVGPGESSVVPRLAAGKTGGQFVLTIANGGTPHRIYRSTSASDFGRSEEVAVVDGQYVDRLDASGADLVFYRIE